MTQAIETKIAAPPAGATGSQLEEAFRLFLQASQDLETQQFRLQSEVSRLSGDLTNANRRLAALLAALPAGVLLVENGVVIDLNPAARAMVPGLSEGQRWAVPDSWSATAVHGEYQTDPESGGRIVQVIEVESGEQRVIQIQDITASIAQHIESQRQSKLASMGQMAASIAHQLRTPLATATLYAGHLSDPVLPEQKRIEVVERLRKQLLTLESLTTRMLQFVAHRPHKTQVVSVHELIEEARLAIAPVCERHGVRLEVRLMGEQGMVSVERDAIVSALVAVLENALQVSPKGSTISLSVLGERTRANILIEDQGPGIDQKLINSIFEPFTTSRPNGTGLGLAIARKAIEAHRGEIHAANRPEGGARFMLTLPCMPSL
jgi:two-component system, sensor histidine kinase FlrB